MVAVAVLGGTALLVRACSAKRGVPTTFAETRVEAKTAGKGCQQGPKFDSSEADLAWNLLNSELMRCPDDDDSDGDDVEPSWAVNPWITKCSLDGSCTVPSNKRETPSIQLEPLFQRREGRASNVALAHSIQLSGFVGHAPPSSVLFNSKAAKIIENTMAPGVWPRRQSLPIAKPRLEVTPFSGEDARALKLTFQEVDLSLCPEKKETKCLLPLTVFTGAKTEQPIWLDMNTEKPCGKKFVPSGPNPEVPIDCFYYVLPDAKVNLTDTASQKKEVSFFKTRGELRLQHQFGRLGKVEVLLGFHLIVSDQPAWTWTTFWWSPDKQQHGHCPIGSKALACELPWSFYAMDDQRYDPKKGKPDPHFNPYIETNNQSNCIYCHARALYHSNGKSPQKDDFTIARDYLKGPLLPCFASKAPAVLSPSDVDCSDATPTHFLWSLANNLRNREPPPQQPK